MARPKQTTPTAGELEILRVLWERGSCSVRDVMEELSRTRPRAYTSVMTILSVMHDKGLVTRQPAPEGRAFIYKAKHKRERTLGAMLSQLLNKAFGGSASALVTQMLAQNKTSKAELEEIRRTIEAHERREGR